MTLPSGISDGDLLRSGNAPEIWLIENGERRYIPDAPTVIDRGGFGKIKIVGADVIAAIPQGQNYPSVIGHNLPDGTLLRATGQDAIYVIQGGERHLIPDLPTLEAGGYDLANILTVSEPEINAIPLGAPIAKAGPIPIDTGIVEHGANHYSQTFGTFSHDGNLNLTTFTGTRTLFGGWTHGYYALIGDAQGRTIAMAEPPAGHTGVDGRAFGTPDGTYTKPGERKITWNFDFGSAIGAQATTVSIVNFYAPKLTIEQIAKIAVTALQILIDVIRLIEQNGGTVETTTV